MKRLSLFALAATLVLVGGCSNCQEPTPHPPSNLLAKPAGRTDKRPPCPHGLARPQDPEGNPQAPFLKGGCLEALTYFEGRLEGGVPTSRQLRARHGQNDAKQLEVSLEESTSSQEPTSFQTKVGSVKLYKALHTDEKGVTTNLCEGEKGQDASLDGKAIVVPGYWDHRSRWIESPERFTVACASGVVAKCATQWSFVPGLSYGGEKDLGGIHGVCVNAARAGYVNGSPLAFTCTNTEIVLADKTGLHPWSDREGFVFESYWGPKGLICKSRSRFEGCDDELQDLVPNRNDCESVARNWSEGGLIAVMSRRDNRAFSGVTGRLICPHLKEVVCPQKP